jgi:predicted DNA-binding transcriptional regulator YafY
MNRLFEIVYVLLSKAKVTVKEQSEHFKVSQRPIYRDIDALSIAGIPVYFYKMNL